MRADCLPSYLFVVIFVIVASAQTHTLAQQVPTTLEDFFLPGTQPNSLNSPIIPSSQSCVLCHGGYSNEDPLVEPHAPYELWKASLMSQASRDPLARAAMTIASQDSADSADICIRCHLPKAWLEGRSVPTDLSAVTPDDHDGVTCHVCHRIVDPIYKPGISPADDEQILNDLLLDQGILPTEPHTASYVIDPDDNRRGPFNLDDDWPDGFFFHNWRESPYHSEAKLCSTCHDVSNPAFDRVGGPTPSASDTYALGNLDEAHLTQNKYDMFPVERTFSEWSQSAFAAGPIEMGGRYGGNITAVSTCQDCHMADLTGTACQPTLNPPTRNNLPKHSFSGASTWVLDSIINLDQNNLLYPNDADSGLTQDEVDAAIERNMAFLDVASDVELTVDGDNLSVRVINETGHKLPTGYPEGRRMWINVQFQDDQGQLVAERGAYDFGTATLTTNDTKVYEAKLGVDAAVSAATGVPEGESFHFVLNNLYIKDNRIPPRGFTNAGFESVQAAPVGYTYADGQHWDDTDYTIPCNAVQATVRVYYQATSREYIEFLRDENTTDNIGQIAYDQWVATGMSTPVQMDREFITFDDCNANAQLDACDVMEPTADVNQNGIPDSCEPAIPAVSGLGMASLALAMVLIARRLSRRRRLAA